MRATKCIIRALTLKKFIISSDCETGPKEILSNGKGGFLFKVGDYKTLAQRKNCMLKIKKIKKRSNMATMHLSDLTMTKTI